MIQWIGAICVVGACGACGFSMAARRVASVKRAGGLVLPVFSASIAALRMCSGVSKSGSPAPRDKTGTPSLFIWATAALSLRVAEGATPRAVAERVRDINKRLLKSRIAC